MVVQVFRLELGRMEMFCCSSLVIWGCGGVVWCGGASFRVRAWSTWKTEFEANLEVVVEL